MLEDKGTLRPEQSSVEHIQLLAYLLLFKEDALADVHQLPVLIYFIIHLIHPLVKGVRVQDPLYMHLERARSK